MSPLTEAFPELRNVHVDEIMTDMDRNKDNYVTLEEYVGECVCVCVFKPLDVHVYSSVRTCFHPHDSGAN